MASSRQPRLHFASFNGTLAGGVLSSRKTVVSEFAKLISDHENVFETVVNGVGTDISLLDRVIGGISGWGTLRNIIDTYKNLATHYRTGDRIILCGYSRGAWAARYLAMLINVAGLPIDGDERLFHKLYKANVPVQSAEMIATIVEGYQFYPDVQIDALCCFDTVGSLGLPLFGLAKPLSLFRRGESRSDVVSPVAPNVRYAFHAIALHETREPFSPTLMRSTTAHQVFFPGTHGDMGWIDDNESLVHAPFAWMVQQLHSHLNISFNHEKLAARFPSYNPRRGIPMATAPSVGRISTLLSSEFDFSDDEMSLSNINTNTTEVSNLLGGTQKGSGWYNGKLSRPRKLTLAIMGKKLRQPGQILTGPGSCNCGNEPAQRGVVTRDLDPRGTTMTPRPEVQIHIGARLRNVIDELDAVPGYALAAPPARAPFWQRRNNSCRSSKRESSSSEISIDVKGKRSCRGDGTCMTTDSLSHPRSSSLKKSMLAERITQAPIGALEAALLGLPETVVDNRVCCETH